MISLLNECHATFFVSVVSRCGAQVFVVVFCFGRGGGEKRDHIEGVSLLFAYMESFESLPPFVLPFKAFAQ